MSKPYWILTVPKRTGDVTLSLYYDENTAVSTHTISREAWAVIKSTFTYEFKDRKLRIRGAENMIDFYIGKEMVVLLLAIDGVTDLEVICRACTNWTRFSPEERWWLYTATTTAWNKKGWMNALHEIMCSDS